MRTGDVRSWKTSSTSRICTPTFYSSPDSPTLAPTPASQGNTAKYMVSTRNSPAREPYNTTILNTPATSYPLKGAPKIATRTRSSNTMPQMQGARPAEHCHHARITTTSITLKTCQNLKWTSKKHIPMLHNSYRHHGTPTHSPNAPHTPQPASTTRTTLEARMDCKSGSPGIPTWHRPKPQRTHRPNLRSSPSPRPSALPRGKSPAAKKGVLLTASVSTRPQSVQSVQHRAALYSHRKGVPTAGKILALAAKALEPCATFAFAAERVPEASYRAKKGRAVTYQNISTTLQNRRHTRTTSNPFLRHKVKGEEICLQHIPTEVQIPNVLTEGIVREEHECFLAA
jgi:hypothetical protein